MVKKKRTQPKDQKVHDENQPKSEETEKSETPADVFPIVGIGASAGGLEACEVFFKHIPPDSGMAYVLVQHLAPDHESILADLLRRCTSMSVFQVEDRMRVQPDSVYVIPPDRDMALLHGALHLMVPAERRGFRLPIDFFFRSLAEDQHDRAICIVLSGTGSDGTLGLKAIRGEGGMSMVQAPESAKYDGMPQSAIATGLADYVLLPEEMPKQLLNYVEHLFVPGAKRVTPVLPKETDALEEIFILLRHHTKHDFSLYKRNTINRRIGRRMAVNQIKHIADYVEYLRYNALEVNILFRELLIGVTSFFRDRDVFDTLEQKVIPLLFENRQSDQPIRVWVPGCSTGEEPYSIAMLIREHMSRLKHEREVQVFATDIDTQAIDKARLGIYPDNIAADVSATRLQQFFIKENGAYQIAKTIREMVVFAIQSVIKDPPFSKMDLISCRNLLIYLGPELQKQIIPLFHYALKPNGFLALGTSETLGEFDTYFSPVDRKARLFQRVTDGRTSHEPVTYTMPSLRDNKARLPSSKMENKVSSARELIEKALLQEFTPPCVIINEQGDILYFHGKTGIYLEPASGEASLNVLQMVREGLRLPLNTAIRRAITQSQKIVHENILFQTADDSRVINLIVQPVDRSDAMQKLYLVVFEDKSSTRRTERADAAAGEVTDERDQRLIAVEHELRSAREYLQTTIEELETTNEEFKSTNEELQSANEELQSTNEELETAKEELQSVNEELVTVNSELQSKIDDLTSANNDLNNLLASVEVGIIFLDRHLRIQRFNPSATELINLIATDIGRPINHLVSNLVYENLGQDMQRVLDTLIPKEIEVETVNKRWYWMRFRPYRTIENAIEGLVLTFTEETMQKRAELARQTSQAAYRFAASILDTVSEALLVLAADLRVVSANQAFYQIFQLSREETEERSIYELRDRQWDTPQLREVLEKVRAEDTGFNDLRIEYNFKTNERRAMLLNARQVHHEPQEPLMILLEIYDITGRQQD